MTELSKEIRAAVLGVLEDNGIAKAPADPFQLAEALGIRVRYFDLGAVKGFYTRMQTIPFIALNRSLPEPQSKIVCAHELGHHVLHAAYTENAFFNEFELYRMENRVEAEANLFAAFLLLPDQAVSFLTRPENAGLSLGEAAGLFGTTEELFTIRLAAEGLPVPDHRLSTFPG